MRTDHSRSICSSLNYVSFCCWPIFPDIHIGLVYCQNSVSSLHLWCAGAEAPPRQTFPVWRSQSGRLAQWQRGEESSAETPDIMDKTSHSAKKTGCGRLLLSPPHWEEGMQHKQRDCRIGGPFFLKLLYFIYI